MSIANNNTDRHQVVEAAIERSRKPGLWRRPAQQDKSCALWQHVECDVEAGDSAETVPGTPSAQRLAELAAKNPPPAEWLDGDEEELF